MDEVLRFDCGARPPHYTAQKSRNAPLHSGAQCARLRRRQVLQANYEPLPLRERGSPVISQPFAQSKTDFIQVVVRVQRSTQVYHLIPYRINKRMNEMEARNLLRKESYPIACSSQLNCVRRNLAVNVDLSDALSALRDFLPPTAARPTRETRSRSRSSGT